MSTTIAISSVYPVDSGDRMPGLDRDRLIADRAKTYEHVFGLRTDHLRDVLRMPVGRVAALVMPRLVGLEVRRVLGRRCGPVCTDNTRSWVFLTRAPGAGIDLAETTLRLYRCYQVMTLAHPDQVVVLPTPGDPRSCWIQPPRDERLPEFTAVLTALDTLTATPGPS